MCSDPCGEPGHLPPGGAVGGGGSCRHERAGPTPRAGPLAVIPSSRAERPRGRAVKGGSGQERGTARGQRGAGGGEQGPGPRLAPGETVTGTKSTDDPFPLTGPVADAVQRGDQCVERLVAGEGPDVARCRPEP